MTIKEFLGAAVQILESPLSTLLLLLATLGLMTWWMRHRLRLQDLKAEENHLESRRNEMECMGFLRSATGIISDYRMMLISMVREGDRRTAPLPSHLPEVDKKFDDLRRRIHDAETMRKAQFEESLRRLRAAQEKEGRKL